MKSSVATLATTILLLSRPAPAAAADPPPAPDQAVPAEMQGDEQICAAESRLIGVSLNTGRMGVPSAGGSIIGMFIGAGYSAALTPKARSEYRRDCLQGRSSHRTDSAPPSTTILPQLKPEPMAFSSLRLNADTLSLFPGVVYEGEKLLTGAFRYRRSAVVKADTSAFMLHIARGSIAYALVVHEKDGVDKTYWCGLGRYGMFGKDVYCVWADPDGYRFYRPDTPDGLIIASKVENQLSKKPTSTYALEDSAVDPSPAIAFDLVVKKIGLGGIRLSAQADIGGKAEEVWSGDVLFDDAGKAALPFWTSRLTFQPSGPGLVAALTPDGDGAGWESVPTPSAH